MALYARKTICSCCTSIEERIEKKSHSAEKIVERDAFVYPLLLQTHKKFIGLVRDSNQHTPASQTVPLDRIAKNEGRY